jgi:integrase
VVALTLGMRRGEVLGLRWSDVDFDGRALHVNQSVQRIATGAAAGKKSELRATETKTDGSRRTIALPNSVVQTLKAHHVRQLQDRLAAEALRGATTDLCSPTEPVDRWSQSFCIVTSKRS